MSPSSPQRPSAEIFHQRKPSLSNSVSSASSTCTSCSLTSSASKRSHRRTQVIDFDPLSMHPTFIAPPLPLDERPYILPEHHNSSEEEVIEEYIRAEASSKTVSVPDDSPTPMQPTNELRQQAQPEGDDYFMYKLNLLQHQERQQLDAMANATASQPSPQARSRWSESTIASIDMAESPQISVFEESDDEEGEDDDDVDISDFELVAPAEREVRQAKSWHNFSHKASLSNPRRPPIQTMDSVENFIKRGGWKRRGIVFQEQGIRHSDGGLF
ncbi:hypothetical protein BN1708_011587, partial [Verticillium longisporum]